MPVVLNFFVPPHAEPHDSSYNRWAEASTYFPRRVIHMIVFSRKPGWKRRAGDPGSAGGFAEASVRTSPLRGSGSAAAAEDGSSSGGDALRRPRKAAPTLSSRGPCDGLPSRRPTLRA